MAKGVIHVGKGTNLSTGNAVENERKGWEEDAYRRKNETPTNNYDWSRHDLNFEVVDGRIIPLGSQQTSLYQRYQDLLKELNFKEYKAGATNKQITYVELIASGGTERMQELAFGNQTVNFERNPEIWHNWDVHRKKQIEEWALDTYRFVCRQFGRENIIGFEVHLDETEPHAHVNIVPTAIKKQRGNVGGYVKVDAEGNPVTYTKGKHVGEVIKLSKGKYDALSEEKKKEYRPATRGSFRTISFAELFGSTRAERSQKLSELHDQYYEQVGKKWGLERGDVWKDLPEEERRKRRRKTKKEAFEEAQAKAAKEKAEKERDKAIVQRDAVAREVAELTATLDENHTKIQEQIGSIEQNNNMIISQLDAISENKREIRSMEESSFFDQIRRHGINPTVRKAIEEEEDRHQDELAQAEKRHQGELAKAQVAKYETGETIKLKNGRQLSWEEYARYMERLHKDAIDKLNKAHEKIEAAKSEAEDKIKAARRDILEEINIRSDQMVYDLVEPALSQVWKFIDHINGESTNLEDFETWEQYFDGLRIKLRQANEAVRATKERGGQEYQKKIFPILHRIWDVLDDMVGAKEKLPRKADDILAGILERLGMLKNEVLPALIKQQLNEEMKALVEPKNQRIKQLEKDLNESKKENASLNQKMAQMRQMLSVFAEDNAVIQAGRKAIYLASTKAAQKEFSAEQAEDVRAAICLGSDQAQRQSIAEWLLDDVSGEIQHMSSTFSSWFEKFAKPETLSILTSALLELDHSQGAGIGGGGAKDLSRKRKNRHR